MLPTLVETVRAKGPFDLTFQNQFFNGWPTLRGSQTAVMAFPVEGWEEYALVTAKQTDNESVEFNVYGAETNAGVALLQALASLSLDEDGSGWREVGERDRILKELQVQYHYMRPSLFHSPYEATCAFLIGHRISIPQARKIRQHICEAHGRQYRLEGHDFYAFPGPQALLRMTECSKLSAVKVGRLHAAAEAALDGWLSRTELRRLDEAVGLNKLATLPGIGAFFSQGILDRGAGRADGFTYDDLTFHAISQRYRFGESPSRDQIVQQAEAWRPYRMWAVVLMHVWLRQTGNLPKRTFSKR
jgi:DNA-3-methyladenine glycosylase II